MRLLTLFLFSVCSAQLPFTPVDTNFTTQEVIIPEDLSYEMMFQRGEPVLMNGETAPAKGKLDFMAYFPLAGSQHGYLWVNHETHGSDSILGDGGGASVLEVRRRNGRWQSEGMPKAVDFSDVRGTWNNCLGFATPWGTVLTSEEAEPHNNATIYGNGNAITDTSDIDGDPAYLNYGWMVEVNVGTQKVMGKRHAMGRFSHEGSLLMEDERTVYMMDDAAPGIFFKFLADEAQDFSAGQLYAYKELEDGGEWLALPRDKASMQDARKVALSLGATFFLRLEDLEMANDGYFYLSETGKDNINLDWATDLGGKPVSWQADRVRDGLYNDPYGRIFRFDPKTNKVNVHMELGAGDTTSNHVSNPDNLAYDAKRNLLIIHEDIYFPDLGRVPEHTGGNIFNEIYVLDMSIKEPKVDDLKRMMVAPRGAETTGSCFTPDYNSLFINLQHPDSANRPPFNKDMTIVLTGFSGE